VVSVFCKTLKPAMLKTPGVLAQKKTDPAGNRVLHYKQPLKNESFLLWQKV